jgi:exodeoxyribonuclease VII large subunit
MDGLHKRFENLELTLREQSPRGILQRGYAIVEKEDRLVSSVAEIKNNDKLKISLKDGEFFADAQKE